MNRFFYMSFSFHIIPVYNPVNWRASNSDFIRHFCEVWVITIDRQFIIVFYLSLLILYLML